MQRFRRPRGGDARHTSNAAGCPGEESWTRQKYNSFMNYPTIARKLRRAAKRNLASLIQDALRRRTELAAFTPGGKSIANWPLICRANLPFPDELVEMLSDEQYFD